MTLFMAWTDDVGSAEELPGLPGPWTDVVVAAPGLLIIESDETLSRVFHEVKWVLGDGSALAVSAVAGEPKTRGMTPGTTSWVRARRLQR